MPKSTEYTFDATDEGDRIRVRHTIERDEVRAFTVQLEVLLDGDFLPAVRYDTAHGRPHRDTLDRSGRVVKKEWLDFTDLNQALTFAESDVKTNAVAYRDAFLRS